MSDQIPLQSPPAAPPQLRVPETPEGFWEPDLVENREIARVLSDHRTLITRALEVSRDPQDTLDRAASAVWMANRMGLPFAYTMENYDAVAKNYWGEVIPPKSARQAIHEAWQGSVLNQKIFMARAQRLFGQSTPELEEQVKEWRRQRPEPDNQARMWTTELFKAAADMLPYQWEALKFAAPIAFGTAGLSAALGVAAGPASEFSIPAAAVGGFLRGLSLGSIAYTFESEAGATFDTLLEMGVREDLARAISIPIAAGKAALERVQLANIPGLKALKQTLEHAVARDLSKELLEKGLISRIANAASARAQGPVGKGLAAFGVEFGVKGLGVEPATEVAQEALDMMAEAAGKAWMKATKEKDIPQATAAESWNRIWQTWRQTAMAMVVTSLPGSAMTGLKSTGAAVGEQAAQRRTQAVTTPKAEEIGAPVKLTEQAPPAAAEDLQTSANAPAPGSIYARFQEPALKSAVITAPDGTSPDRARTVGRIDYRVDARTADILILQMVPGQEQHARATLLELMKENAGKHIRWNPSDAAGIALRQELIETNPRRQEMQASIDTLSEAHERQKANLGTAADEAARTAIAADMGRLEAEIDRTRRKTKSIGLQWYTEADLTEESRVAQVAHRPEASVDEPWRVGRQEYSDEAVQASQTEADRALVADPARGFLASAFPRWDRGEVDVAGTLIDLRAQTMGLSTEAWMEKYFSPGVFKRWQGSFLPADVFAKISPDAFTLNQAKIAATEFLEDGRALLHLAESADFTSLVHELAHVFRRQLNEGDATVAAEWAGAAQGWTRAAEEKWAQGLEDYIRDGNTPTPELANVFQRFTEWLKRIYQALSAHVEISSEIRRVYDRLFAVEEEPAGRAEAKAPSILFQPGESTETPSSRLNRLVQSAPVVISTPAQWQEADLSTLRKLAREEYSQLGDVVNKDTGKTVQFVQTGFKELQRHSATRDIMQIVHGLRELAINGTLLWDEPDRRQRRDIKAWHNFGGKAVLNGQEIFVHLVAWEENKRGIFVDLFHDADTIEAEKVRGLLQPAVPLPMRASTETSPAAPSQPAVPLLMQATTETTSARNKLLQWIRAVKSGELSDTSAQTGRVLEDPAFRDWFAASQAVDEQGRPRVFYHGTYATFGAFEETRDLGYHFGSSEQAAVKIGGEAAGEGARIIPVYLSIRNPLRLTQDIFSRFDAQPLEEASDALAREAGLSADAAASLHQMAAHVSQLRDTLGPAESRYQDAREAFWDQARRALVARGFDGVVYPNEAEGAGESWIAFESHQVKSVFNKGTWSQSPNILFQEGPEEGEKEEQPPVDAKSAEEHQAATQEAVAAGEAVPQEVLQEYGDSEWAKREIAARRVFIKDAKTFDTFDDFAEYATAMATPEEPVHATEYYSMIWDQAKGEQTVNRRTANQRFLESMTKEQLSGVLEDAAHKDKLEGLHRVMRGVALGLKKNRSMSDEAYAKIMAQLRDDPTRYRAIFAEITGDEESIRQLVAEERQPQKETLEERLRRANRELRQQVKVEQTKVSLSAREARLEKSYSGDLERRIRKLEQAHEEEVAQMKLTAANKLKSKVSQQSELGRERIKRIRDSQAMGRQKQSANRKVREGFNRKIRRLQKIRAEIPYMHPEAKGPLTALLEDILLKRMSSQRRLQLQEIRTQLESNPEYEMPEDWKQTLADLDRKSVRDMTVAEFDTLYNAVLHYAHRNKEIQQQRVGAERMRQDQVLKTGLAELRKSKPLPTDEFSEEGAPRETEVVGGRGKTRRKIRAVYDTLIGMGQDHYNLIVERIAGPESLVYRLFVRGIEEARKVQLAYKQQVHRRFQGYIASLGISNITAWLAEVTPVDRFELTRGERMALWMHAANEDNRDSILRAGFGLKRREGDRRFHFNDEAELQMLLDTVSDQEKIFTAAAGKLFQEQGRALARVFLEKNGYELAVLENYYPKDVMAIGRGSEAAAEDALERFKGLFMRIGLSKGMLKTRKSVAVPLYLNNIAYDIERSVSRAAAYVGFEIPLTHASRLLYDKDFREQLSTRFTPRLWKEIEQGLRDIAGEYQEIDSTERNLLKYRSGITMAFLGFNPYSILKQPLSLGNALPYVRARYLAQGLAETIGRGRDVFAQHRANSPVFEHRLEVGFTRDIADAARLNSEGRLYGARTTAQRWGFLGIKSADAFTVASVMRGAWLQGMAELERGSLSRDVALAMDLQGRSISNLSVEDRNALAYKFADFVSTRTQDQALPEYRSSLSRSKFGKFFTMFGSSSNVALNVLRRSIVGVKNEGDGPAVRRLAMAILAVGVMGPAGEAAVNMLRRVVRGAFSGDPPPDDERLRTFIGDYIQNVGGLLFFVRDATNTLINALQYGPFATSTEVSNPIAFLTDTVQTLVAIGVSAMTEDDYLERRRKWTRFIDQTALTASLLTQMPLYMPAKGLTRIFGEPPQKKRR